MNYNTATLPCGLRLIYLPSSSPVVYCGYVVAAGSRHERPNEEGLAHFCEHVTFKGTEHRKAWNILNSLESVGGDLNAFTNKEDTTFYASVRKEHVARAIDLLTDIVFHSVYPQKEINKEVAVICDEIESYNDSPSELIFDEFENILFKNHPLGHNILGTADQVRSYQTADALRFTREHYLASRAAFFLYGDVPFQRVVRMLERATSDLPKAEPETLLPQHESLQPQLGAGEDAIVVNRHTHQSHVVVGGRSFSANDERRLPLYVLNNLLGGPGMNARLNLSLRERNGLVYTVESSMANYSETGVWCTYFGCDGADVDRCLRLVRRELDRVIDAPLTDRQLNAAKRQIIGQLAIAYDNRETLALDAGRSFLHNGWERDIIHFRERLEAVTPEDVLQAARKVFCKENLTTLVYE
ncbi:MAG: M16 family metallopeptidase [Prevotella sp.]|jgi:predicted Zn-dependent peptidase